ncbi:MAG: L-ribulose-5-phosphate 4-epimerase AraD [Spirochaetes bacterium]|nr:L-ribulose-5-phosphate 4-epimerase AraD [Spirochaetota bacterium]
MLSELKRRVYEANMELSERGLVVYTFGNASEIDRERGIVAIKPSGVDYSTLGPEQIVLVDLNGKRVEGELNPSSDTRTHCRLYREWEGIGGIVHTHSRYATAWAQAKRPLPCFGTTHADYFYGEVPCTEVIGDKAIERDYEEETGVQIVDAFAGIDCRHMKAVLVACHGPFVWGADAREAVYLSVMLEEVATTGFFTVLLDPESKGIKKSLLDKHYLRKHGKDAYYGQERVP